jgi:hypothetical protein
MHTTDATLKEQQMVGKSTFSIPYKSSGQETTVYSGVPATSPFFRKILRLGKHLFYLNLMIPVYGG